MIPAQRTGTRDRPDAAPAYRMAVTDPGSNQAGPGFRTHRATVQAIPAATPNTHTKEKP